MDNDRLDFRVIILLLQRFCRVHVSRIVVPERPEPYPAGSPLAAWMKSCLQAWHLLEVGRNALNRREEHIQQLFTKAASHIFRQHIQLFLAVILQACPPFAP